MEIKSHLFPEMSRKALGDPYLQEALAKATNQFMANRLEAFSQFEEAESIMGKAREIREKTLENLDEYLGKLENKIRENGGIVHRARNAQEALGPILSLIKRHDVELVVKSKSMATEEIGLNEVLDAHGVEVVETDLGEYIVQLAGEKPSHILAPAIHKTKEQIAKLFSQKIGSKVPAEIEALITIARNTLRDKFYRAHMGITGVNFAIAELGVLAILTNEGNGRLVSTLPPIHVAIMGIEKVVPSLEDFMILVKLLPRSATGQKISSYLSLITGPRRDWDLDGSREFHLILLDNGRGKISEGEFRESLYCIRCGACLNVCPVYQKIGGHPYGWVYPGPIGLILTPLLNTLVATKYLPHASTLCALCSDTCPVKVDIPWLCLNLRRKLVEEGEVSKQEKIIFRLWARTLENSFLYRMLSRFSFLASPLFRWAISRDLPIPAQRPFWKRWKDSTFTE